MVAYVAGALASVPAMQTAGRAASNAMAGKGAAVVGFSAAVTAAGFVVPHAAQAMLDACYDTSEPELDRPPSPPLNFQGVLTLRVPSARW